MAGPIVNVPGGNGNEIEILVGRTAGSCLTNAELRATPVPVTFDAGGGLTVSGTVAVSAISSPVQVTGAFYQATQPVSISGSVPVTGTFWQATQPVSIASQPLPTGAATSANQATEISSLGSIDTKLTSVSTSALQTTGNNSLASIDTKLTSPLAVTGAFYQTTQPVSIASNVPVNLNNAAGNAFASGSPADGQTNTQVALHVNSRNTVFNGTTWDRWRGDTTGGAWTQGPAASGAAAAGNPNQVGGVYSASGNLTLQDVGDVVSAQTDPYGNLRATMTGRAVAPQETATVVVYPFGHSTNGLPNSPLGTGMFYWNSASSTWNTARKPAFTARLVSAAASTNATSVKASAGDLFRVTLYNANAAARYLKFYNKASAPTVGTDVPVWTEYLPAQTKTTMVFETPLAFSTGIAYALTTGGADSDTGALTAADVLGLNIAYA